MRPVAIVRVGDLEWATSGDLGSLGIMSADVTLMKGRVASSCDVVIDDNRGEIANLIGLPHTRNAPEVKVWFGWHPTLSQIFDGRLTSLRVQYLPGEVQITATDKGTKHRKQGRARTLATMSAAQFVRQIADESGLSVTVTKEAELETFRFSEILQHGESNADVLQRVLEGIGWESHIRGETLHVRPKTDDSGSTNIVEIALGRDVLGRPSFEVDAFTRRRTPNVYDATGEPVFNDSTADPDVTERLVVLDQTGLLLTNEDFPSYTSQAIERAQAAQANAQEVFRGSLTLDARPDLDVSQMLLLRGFGARWNGLWRISMVKHDLVRSTTTVEIFNGGAA